MKILYVTGYKNYELGIYSNEAKEVEYIKKALLRRLIHLIDDGLEWVIITGQLGVELWAAEVTLLLREQYPQLQLAVITPFLQQEANWSEKNKEYYEYIVSQADFVESISHKPYISPIQFKNRDQFLLQKSDGLLVVYDYEKEGSPQYIVKAAKEYQEYNPYEILNIDFYDIQQLIEEDAFEHNNY
ncbi:MULTISPECIES: DUF1273 domain-containing protein [Bacillus]|uniref:DUF1273 domain-containing protein n=1 Tax=Bacillus TaxID=1386 RepID=UPI0002DE35CD|nr:MULTISPECIES: DUF1273 domain-containing protein [Bacillus]